MTVYEWDVTISYLIITNKKSKKPWGTKFRAPEFGAEAMELQRGAGRAGWASRAGRTGRCRHRGAVGPERSAPPAHLNTRRSVCWCDETLIAPGNGLWGPHVWKCKGKVKGYVWSRFLRHSFVAIVSSWHPFREPLSLQWSFLFSLSGAFFVVLYWAQSDVQHVARER